MTKCISLDFVKYTLSNLMWIILKIFWWNYNCWIDNHKTFYIPGARTIVVYNFMKNTLAFNYHITVLYFVYHLT